MDSKTFVKEEVSRVNLNWKKVFVDVPAEAVISINVNGVEEFSDVVPKGEKQTFSIELRGSQESA